MLSQTFGYRHKSLEIRLYPSKIHFTNCIAAPDDPMMEAFCEKVLEKGEYPRLQVTEKGGHYFTLNNTRLHLFKRLQDMGYCSKVFVEKIPLCDIPCGIQDMMTVSMETTFKPKRKIKRRGYFQVYQKEDNKTDSESSTDEDDDDDEAEDESETDSDLDDTSEEEKCDDDNDDGDDDGGNIKEQQVIQEEESLL